MNRVGEFEKVSYEQFKNAMQDTFGIEEDNMVRQAYEKIQLPRRATNGSAGYDFFAPFDFSLSPGKTIKIPTGIRVQIDEGWWLGCLPRSGLGFKFRLQLNNTMGVIDSDYYYSDNEGHIFAKITNDSNEDKTVSLKAGDAFMQAIFLPYGITWSDDARGVRNGGMGSTGGHGDEPELLDNDFGTRRSGCDAYGIIYKADIESSSKQTSRMGNRFAPARRRALLG